LRFLIEDKQLSAIVTDREVPGGVPLVRLEAALGTAPHEIYGRAKATAESTAYIMYTSGSTGTPKGVEVTQRGVIRLVKNASYVDFGPAEVFAQISNSSFDAITFEVWGAPLNGARLVILPTSTVSSPEAFAAAIETHHLSAMFLTSSLFNVIAARCPQAFRTVRHLLVGGDAVDPHWARHVLETALLERIINGYGPTECTTFSVTHDMREVPEGAKSVPIGRPLSNSQAYVLDWNMQAAPVGVAGELYLGGDGLAKGYWNRPELDAMPLSPNGKVDRRNLPPIQAAPAGTATPMTEAQQTVAEIWKKVLGAREIGLDDNFFEVGGDTLLIANVECELRPRFRTAFTITDLFEFSTIRTLAARLSGEGKQSGVVSEAQERARRQKMAMGGVRTVIRGA
jgi:non-ribosomal peptide synthetase component F